MSIVTRILGFFVKDSAERRRFTDEFNVNAKQGFQTLFVDTLFVADSCEGALDSNYRHELSAPRAVSGFRVQAKAGTEIPAEDILSIGRIILNNQVLVRRLFVLHWDTLYVSDARTGKSICWKIRDYLNFGGLIY